MVYSKTLLKVVAAVIALFLLSSCTNQVERQKSSASNRLRVVATTTIVGDIVNRIGGNKIDLHVLLPIGTDPHRFEPAASDAAKLSGADLIFINGLGLERSLSRLLFQDKGGRKVVAVSEGVTTRSLDDDHTAESEGHAQDDLAVDPHVWMDPQNVKVWADNISRALADSIPSDSSYFKERAEQLKVELDNLEVWIKGEVSVIPIERRKLITDHETLGYFAHRYGFQLSGSIIPGFSSLASPSAKEMAAMQRLIKEEGIQTIFLGMTASPILVEQLAEDTGIHFVSLYTASLSERNGPAADYFSYMRYNVEQIVNALK